MTVQGPALIKGEFTIADIPLREYYVRAGDTVTVHGQVQVVKLPADIDDPFQRWGIR